MPKTEYVVDPNVFAATFLAGAMAGGAFRASSLFNESGGQMKEAWRLQVEFIEWVNKEADAAIAATKAREKSEADRLARVEREDKEAAQRKKEEAAARFGQKQAV